MYVWFVFPRVRFRSGPNTRRTAVGFSGFHRVTLNVLDINLCVDKVRHVAVITSLYTSSDQFESRRGPSRFRSSWVLVSSWPPPGPGLPVVPAVSVPPAETPESLSAPQPPTSPPGSDAPPPAPSPPSGGLQTDIFNNQWNIQSTDSMCFMCTSSHQMKIFYISLWNTGGLEQHLGPPETINPKTEALIFYLSTDNPGCR